jgi:DNA (cytosine-5)-methyltransferase 1
VKRSAPADFASWEKPAPLTFQEMCRIQTFPEGLSTDGGRTERQLGNAVPSFIAEILAREVRAQLLYLPIKTKLCHFRRGSSPLPPS